MVTPVSSPSAIGDPSAPESSAVRVSAGSSTASDSEGNGEGDEATRTWSLLRGRTAVSLEAAKKRSSRSGRREERGGEVEALTRA